jgi:hypothetical protein
MGPQSGELSVNVGLRFSRFTQITSSYKDVFTYGRARRRAACAPTAWA